MRVASIPDSSSYGLACRRGRHSDAAEVRHLTLFTDRMGSNFEAKHVALSRALRLRWNADSEVASLPRRVCNAAKENIERRICGFPDKVSVAARIHRNLRKHFRLLGSVGEIHRIRKSGTSVRRALEENVEFAGGDPDAVVLPGNTDIATVIDTYRRVSCSGHVRAWWKAEYRGS